MIHVLTDKMLCHDNFTNISGIQSVVSVNMRKVFLKAVITDKIIIIWNIAVINTIIGVFFIFLTLNQGQRVKLTAATIKILIFQCLLYSTLTTTIIKKLDKNPRRGYCNS